MENSDELIEQLTEAGFTPFGEIEELNAETVLKENIFEHLFSIDNPIRREQLLAKLEKRAKELDVKNNFKRIYKHYQELDNKNKQVRTHNEIAEELLKNDNIVVYENSLYIYKNGVYVDDENYIYTKIINICKDANTSLRKEVYNYLMLIAPKAEISKNTNIVNFKNALFDLNTKQILPHSPEFFSVNQINVNINKEVKNNIAINNFLDTITCYKADRKKAILEMIGYSMTTSIKMQRSFVLYGKTAGNGKSTLLELIEAVIGKNNISHVTMHDLSNNKFSIAEIRGKLLNISSEMTKEFLKDISIFKELVTGDMIAVEEKFKSRQNIKPYAKLIFTANELPKVSDTTNGYYRRLFIIPFEAKFTEQEKAKFNFNELIQKEALEYLAYRAINSYCDVENNFSNEIESKQIVELYKIENNNVLSYFKDSDSINALLKGMRCKYKTEVYAHYKNYCQNNGLVPKGRNKFYQEALETGFVKEGIYNGYGTFIFNKT